MRPEGVKEALSAAGFAPGQYLKPEELRGIGELEKLAGKKRFAELAGDCIEKPKGKPTLVPETDKRPEWNSAAEDFEGVAESITDADAPGAGA